MGGALGIAVLGSLGTMVYRGMLESALPAGIPADLGAPARDTLGGALSVAAQLTDPVAAAALTLTAQEALTTSYASYNGLAFPEVVYLSDQAQDTTWRQVA